MYKPYTEYYLDKGFLIKEDKLPYKKEDINSAYVIHIDWKKNNIPKNFDKRKYFAIVCNEGYDPIMMISNDMYVTLFTDKLTRDKSPDRMYERLFGESIYLIGSEPTEIIKVE